ncbi:MAG TPA: protein kinase [Polyangiaceae bacterium]|nr:protein kinase [Polyangiaceae bacterium]
MLRAIGPRGASTWAALELSEGGQTQLVVVERTRRGGALADPDIAGRVRDAKHLAKLEHPNVARVRDVVIRSDEILVVGDFIDGVPWARLGSGAPGPPFEATLRILVDVLSGLAAMHNLRDEKRTPLKLVHGGLTPDRVLVGSDGVSRVLRAPPRGPGGGRLANAYLAPEVLLEDDSADSRADTYSVGAILWEALSGHSLFPGLGASAIVTQLLSGRVPPPTPRPGAEWTVPLVDMVTRAMAPDPDRRFESAAVMAAELRRIAGARLATPAQVLSIVQIAEGEVIAERRARLERGEVKPIDAGDPSGQTLDIAILIDKEEDPERLSAAAAPIPSVLTETPAAIRPPVIHWSPPEEPARTTLTGSSHSARPREEGRRRGRSRTLVVLAAVASMLVATSALGWWLRTRPPAQAASTPAAETGPPAEPKPIAPTPAPVAAPPTAAAPSTTTSPSTTAATPGGPLPSGAVPVPAAPKLRPGPRRHYQPEGI